jgi:hypothetical protein
MLGGSDFAPMSYRETPVAGLLPVKVAGGVEAVAATVHPLMTSAGARSQMTLLHSAETPEQTEKASQQAWSLVQPLYNVPRLEGAKPGATVLLSLQESVKRTQPYPLLAWQRYGSGKTMFVGTDQLWRLRFKTGDYYHARFWGQAIQFLTLSRLLGENRRIRLETDQKSSRTGERVSIYASVLNELYEPDGKWEAYPVEVERPQGGNPLVVKLRPVPGSPGLFQGSFVPEQAGCHEIHSEPGDRGHSSTAQLDVIASNRERLDPAMRKDLLQQMAERAGGRVVGMEELGSLDALIEGAGRTSEVRSDEDLWDRWPVLPALLALVGLEWFLRRSFDLA